MDGLLDIAPLGGEKGVSGLGDITINPFILAWHASPELHYAAVNRPDRQQPGD